ncbi:hypothetical protein [Pseudarthrobacter sp. PvP090]|uniref:hypothetical protein n=1 Tax=Pseudarthrobacter sp. PvP090 TaxID=3156393 RepID=UPI00339B5F23
MRDELGLAPLHQHLMGVVLRDGVPRPDSADQCRRQRAEALEHARMVLLHRCEGPGVVVGVLIAGAGRWLVHDVSWNC